MQFYKLSIYSLFGIMWLWQFWPESSTSKNQLVGYKYLKAVGWMFKLYFDDY